MQDSWLVSEVRQIKFPEGLADLLDKYFCLDKDNKEAFYAATHLWV